MNYKIILKDKEQAELNVELEKEEIDKIWQALQNKEVKMIKLGDKIVNTAFIMLIEPSGQDLISEEFRLPEPKFEFEEENRIKGIESLFDLLKSKGLFKDYKNYKEYAQNLQKKL